MPRKTSFSFGTSGEEGNVRASDVAYAVAAFLNYEEWKTGLCKTFRHRPERLRAQQQVPCRIAFHGIKSYADYKNVGFLFINFVERSVKNTQVFLGFGTWTNREIFIESKAFPGSRFFGETGKIGIGVIGMAMNGDGKYVVPIVKDVLRAVSMMKIDIEDGGFCLCT